MEDQTETHTETLHSTENHTETQLSMADHTEILHYQSTKQLPCPFFSFFFLHAQSTR